MKCFVEELNITSLGPCDGPVQFMLYDYVSMDDPTMWNFWYGCGCHIESNDIRIARIG